MNQQQCDKLIVPEMSVFVVESLKSAEVGHWTEQSTAEEEVPGLVRWRLNS